MGRAKNNVAHTHPEVSSPSARCSVRARAVRASVFPLAAKKHVRSPRRHGLLHSKYAWLTFSRTVFAHISLSLFSHHTDMWLCATSHRVSAVCPGTSIHGTRKPSGGGGRVGSPATQAGFVNVTAQARFMFRDSHSTYAHGTPTITHNTSHFTYLPPAPP